MKKLILSALSVIFVGSIVFISCKPKNDNDAITPTYKDEAPGGTGNNPNITNVTTTGTIATTSTQQNSTMTNVGVGAAWTSTGCQAGQTCLTNVNTSTSTTVTICFSTPPTAGSYQLVNSSSLLGPGKAFMTVTNPPSQDAGSVWYSSAGTITVTVGGSGNPIKAFFNNIACYKTPGSFYSVTVSGEVGCL
ncbi:MAG: hypothetical protein U0W65_12600 [Bacteroidia bacterium]